MAGFTIYLDEMEERDRKQRRRAKIFGAIAIVATLMAFRAPKATPPAVVTRTIERLVPVEIECTVMQPVEKEIVASGASHPPSTAPPFSRRRSEGQARSAFPLLPLRGRLIDLAPSPPPRHLCVTPKRLLRFSAVASDRVTVSNIGETAIRIMQIVTVPERSSFFV